MKLPKRALAIGSMAAVLTLGTAGIVAAAGAQGHGPASALSSLVSDGTITQDQADKVAGALEKNREERKAEHEAKRAEMQALITKTLGISESDLETAREEGKSLADLAGDKRDELVSAMVAFQTAKLDKAVAAGKVTQEQADKIKANMQKRVEDRVDGKDRGGKGQRPGGRGPGGSGAGGPGGGPEDGAMFGGPAGADSDSQESPPA